MCTHRDRDAVRQGPMQACSQRSAEEMHAQMHADMSQSHAQTQVLQPDPQCHFVSERVKKVGWVRNRKYPRSLWEKNIQST